MRLLPATMLIVALGIGRASAEDNGERLFQMFERTCATKPVSGEALDAQARGLGYVSRNAPVSSGDLTRKLDDIYDWKLPDQGFNFALNAYLFGPRAHYQVSCSIHARDVDPAALLAIVKRETALPDPQTKTDPETGMQSHIWTAEVEGGKDTMQINTFKNGNASITLNYDVIAR